MTSRHPAYRSGANRHAPRRHVLARRIAGVEPRRVRRPGGWLVSAAVVVITAIVLAAFGTGVFAISTVQAVEATLPPVSEFATLTYKQVSTVYDQTGTVKLATIGTRNRIVLTFDQIPRLVLDATTSAEDHTFWSNPGYDPQAILAASVEDIARAGKNLRGASTITQQLVRARLLPPQVVAPTANQVTRKVDEIIQAARLTEVYPGIAGKEAIITAYLNQVYYGDQAYGYAAAAKTYFGVTDLAQLTPAQAALLAGLVQSPSYLDPYLYAKPNSSGQLVVPQTAPLVIRRNYILQQLAQYGRWTHLTPAQLKAAQAEPVILHPEPAPAQWKAPQFVIQVQQQLDGILGTSALDTGGYKIITTLDWNAQQLAQKLVYAAAVLPNLSVAQMNAGFKQLGISAYDQSWMRALRGRDPHDAALVAMDYRTGNVLAYVGSAGYYLTNLTSPKFQPQFDVAGVGARQPGSAIKPVEYAAGFQDGVITPGTLLMDVSTPFVSGWAPHDADLLDKGPVLARKALQYSLNVPTIRAYSRIGATRVLQTAHALNLYFPGGDQEWRNAGLTAAIGTVEVRLIDLLDAYGGLANYGLSAPIRMIDKVVGPNGQLVYQAPIQLHQAVMPQAAFLVDNILEGNTNPSQNLLWGPLFHINNGPGGAYRPAALKTGTTDGTLDLSAYGFLAPPANPKSPGLAVGVWMGNSDHSGLGGVAFAVNGPAQIWRAFMSEYSKNWPVADWAPPPGVVQTTIDAYSGGTPGPWTRATVKEWFIAGTQPGAPGQIDPPGLLYQKCGETWYVDPVKAEASAPASWQAADANWAQRAARGTGIVGPYGTATAYMYGRSSWGGPISTSCLSP